MAVKIGPLTPQEAQEAQQQRTMAELERREPERLAPLSEQERMAVAQQQAAEVAQTPSLLETPTEALSEQMRMSPRGFRGDDSRIGMTPPTRTEQISQEVATQGSSAIANELVGVATPDPVTGRVAPRTPEQAQQMVDEGLAMSSSAAIAEPEGGFGTTDPQELRLQVEEATGRKSKSTPDSFSNVITLGQDLTSRLNQNASVTFKSNDDVSVSLQQALIEGNLLDPTTRQATARLGNIAAFSLLEMIQDELVVKNTLVADGSDPVASFGLEDLSDYLDAFDSLDPSDDIAKLSEGDVINPDLARLDPSTSVFDKALPNPNKVGDAYSAYGGASRNISPEAKAAFKTLYYQALNDIGFLKPRVDGKGYEMSQSAIDFFFTSRDVLTDISPNLEQLPSLFENIEGESFGAERTRGSRKSGNVSVKTKRPFGDNQELEAMDNMGRVQHRVNDDMFSVGQRFINDIIKYRITEDGRAILNRRTPLKDRDPSGRMFSNDPYAKRLGLDKSVYDKHFRNAKIAGLSDADADDQASAIMASKARRLAKEAHYGTIFSGKTFFVRKLYAASTSRFYDRNTVLSPQGHKFTRNILMDAQPVFIDVRKENEIMDVWMLHIGRLLLTKADIQAELSQKYDNDVTVEDMFFNETLKITKKKIFNERYDAIIKVAKEVRKLVKNPSADINAGLANIGLSPELANKLNDPEEWGFILQALVDMAEYDDAKKTTKARFAGDGEVIVRSTIPEGERVSPLPVDEKGNLLSPRARQLQSLLDDAILNEDQEAIQMIQADMFKELGDTKAKYPEIKQASPIFQAKVQSKSDGKSSGQAIQAGLFADEDMMKRTGLMFDSNENTIPFGSIRTLFLDNILPRDESRQSTLKSVFKTDNEKLSFWQSFFEEMLSGENRKLLETSLAKRPIMETGYNKNPMFQHKSALEIASNFNLAEKIKVSFDQRYPIKAAIIDLNNIIKTTLEQTLHRENQTLMKDVGLAWSLLANATARFVTPTGKEIAIGSTNRVRSDKSFMLPTARGEIEIPLYSREYTSTDRTKETPRQYQADTMTTVTGQQTPFGQEAANQFPVLVIQAIDAAIMAMTFNYVNKGRDAPLYAVDIHDALILNPRSYKEYHRAYNRIFEELVSPTSNKQYDVWASLGEPLNIALKEFVKEYKGNKTPVKINYDSMKYRALHQMLNKLEDKRLGRQVGPDYFDDYADTRASSPIGYSEGQSILKLAKSKGWTPDGGVLTAEEAAQLSASLIVNYLKIPQRFTKAKSDTKQKKDLVIKNRKNEVSQNLG